MAPLCARTLKASTKPTVRHSLFFFIGYVVLFFFLYSPVFLLVFVCVVTPAAPQFISERALLSSVSHMFVGGFHFVSLFSSECSLFLSFVSLFPSHVHCLSHLVFGVSRLQQDPRVRGIAIRALTNRCSTRFIHDCIASGSVCLARTAISLCAALSGM